MVLCGTVNKHEKDILISDLVLVCLEFWYDRYRLSLKKKDPNFLVPRLLLCSYIFRKVEPRIFVRLFLYITLLTLSVFLIERFCSLYFKVCLYSRLILGVLAKK